MTCPNSNNFEIRTYIQAFVKIRSLLVLAAECYGNMTEPRLRYESTRVNFLAVSLRTDSQLYSKHLQTNTKTHKCSNAELFFEPD